MRLANFSAASGPRRALNAVLAGLAFASPWLAIYGASAQAQSVAPVRYSISPAASSIQPDGTVNITLSVQTDVEIAGGSVHLVFNNADYAGTFQTASPTGIYFIKYEADYDDVLFICSNNRCAPGTYQIGTVSVKVGSAGNSTVAFNPKETADPSLNLIQASGTTGTYSVKADAPASPSRPNGSTYTIPKSNDDGTAEPTEVTNEQYADRQQQANSSSGQSDNNDKEGSDSSDESFWTARNIVIAGIAVSFTFIVTVLILAKFFMGGGPKGPGGPTITPGSNGPIYYR